MKPSLIFDNENRFVDITDERTKIRYRQVEEIDGHRFIYIKYGIYAAEPSFVLDNKEMEELLGKYTNVSFITEPSGNERHRVIFACSPQSDGRCAEINYINNTDDSDITKYYSKGAGWLDWHKGWCKDTNGARRMEPVFEQSEDKPWIKINNKIGFKVEDGIYFFPSKGVEIGECTWSLPVLSTMSKFEGVHVAGICHSTDFHPSFDIAVEYLAIGKENFQRLEQIHLQLHEGFFYEFDSESVEDSNESGVNTLDESLINQENINCLCDKESGYGKLEIEHGAVELVKGIGVNDIILRFERPFFQSDGFKLYAAAYRLGEDLVLINRTYEEYKIEKHPLRFLSGLYVKEKVVLNNGIEYPVIHSVIDCREERLKEILTPEAYELYLKEMEIPSASPA